MPRSKNASLQEELRNLYGVECRSLLDLVTTYKQVQSLLIVTRDVTSHAPYEDIVLGSGVQRRWEPAYECMLLGI